MYIHTMFMMTAFSASSARKGNERFIGIFNFSDSEKTAWMQEEGTFRDLITDQTLELKDVELPAYGLCGVRGCNCCLVNKKRRGLTDLFLLCYIFIFISCSGIQKLLAELLCHCIDLCHISHRWGEDSLYIVLKPCDILLFSNIPFMTLICSRCPASVLNEADGAVLVITLCQVLDECTHKPECFSVVSNAGQYQLAVAESILHCLCHVFLCKIADNNLQGDPFPPASVQEALFAFFVCPYTDV